MTLKRKSKSSDHDSESDDDAERDSGNESDASDSGPTPQPALTAKLLHPLLQCTLCIGASEPRHQRSFVNPVTLSCGHTLCRSHLVVPSAVPPQHASSSSAPPPVPPPLPISLNCPIPGCTYSQNGTPQTQLHIHPNSGVISYSSPVAQRPRRPNTQPTVSADALKIDISVTKVQNLVSEAVISDDEGEGGPSTKPPRKRPRIQRTTGPEVDGRPPEKMGFSKILLEVLTCGICFSLYYEPITPLCGHTFCAKCLQRTLDHHSKCPICRQELPPGLVSALHFLDVRDREPPVNKVILGIILLTFRQEYLGRRESLQEEANRAIASRLDTPICVDTQCAFPGSKLLYKFFEPRERMMLRRVLATQTPQFGVMLPPLGIIPEPSGIPHGYGTIMQIRSVQLLPDSSSIVEAEGVGRLRVLESDKLDGYIVSRIERVEDLPFSDDEESQIQIPPSVPHAPAGLQASASGVSVPPSNPAISTPTTRQLLDICRSFVEEMRADTAPFVVRQLNNTYGDEPQNDPVAFVWWMASLLPIDSYDKIKLLAIRSPQLRLRLTAHWITQLKQGWWYDRGCTIC